MSATLSCPDCGTQVRPTGQSFCDVCGTFLKWGPSGGAGAGTPGDGAAGAPDARPRAASPVAEAPAVASGTDGGVTVPEDVPPAEASRPGGGDGPVAAAVSRSAAEPPHGPDLRKSRQEQGGATAVGGTGATGATGQDAGPDVTGSDVTGPDAAGSDAESTTPMAPVPAAPVPAAPVSEGGGADAARALLVPVPDPAAPSAPAGAPGGVLPARPDAPRPRPRTVAAPAAPEEGRPCPDCGVPNAPHRHFCRTCAVALAPRAVEPPTGPYAGQRPPLPRAGRRWLTRALVAAGVVALLVGAVIGGPPTARAVQDHFAKRVAVRAETWQASNADPAHGADLAFDGYSNTWWGTGYSGDSAGQYLEASFGQPTDLLGLIITPGTSNRSGQRAAQARPQEFDLLVIDSSGKTHTSRHTINDGGAQKVKVRVRDAVTVRLVIRSAYGAARDKQVAIAELEFFGRSAARS
ncbi:discoidin domain-containing protein [Streptomyces yaizuensis]|uniref:Zinc ribbon domain-containing protein n=1 Tax=Streptomyces yaizuensis TaxID=2989713 RepID=A0ABQ5P2K7_9ACTN|nr:discoidin domain-containing protein [Streptomyces sp. YSPA8]GLF96836.1 zinc ribbon domain-containing protein [Streptomyces sp. YSPA8]